MAIDTSNVQTNTQAQQRAKRLKSLREMTGLSRNDFYQRYGISKGTLQNWESARFGGLTTKGATTILQAFHAEGIYCEKAWLLEGTGNTPQFITNSQQERHKAFKQHCTANENIFEQESHLITKEILLFRQNHKQSIDIMITDDAMKPYWYPGDYIAGIKRYQTNIKSTIGQFCIVQTADYGTLLRKVQAGDEEGLYNLIMTNHSTTVKKPFIYNTKIISSAPVIWTRRMDIL